MKNTRNIQCLSRARVMVDTYLGGTNKRRRLAEVYSSRWDNAVDLISDLYYEGNHLACSNGCVHDKNQIICGWHIAQKFLYDFMGAGQSAFEPYLRDKTTQLKENKDKIKDLLEDWIKESNILSNHTNKKAIDIGSANKNQHKDFQLIAKNHEIIVSEPYPNGNYHVEGK